MRTSLYGSSGVLPGNYVTALATPALEVTYRKRSECVQWYCIHAFPYVQNVTIPRSTTICDDVATSVQQDTYEFVERTITRAMRRTAPHMDHVRTWLDASCRDGSLGLNTSHALRQDIPSRYQFLALEFLRRHADEANTSTSRSFEPASLYTTCVAIVEELHAHLLLHDDRGWFAHPSDEEPVFHTAHVQS